MDKDELLKKHTELYEKISKVLGDAGIIMLNDLLEIERELTLLEGE